MSRRNEDFDEFCDPDNPKLIKYDDVVETARKVRPFIIKTPCLAAHTQRDLGIYVHYKMEFLQRSGSFKERGAVNVLQELPLDKKKIGVIIASTGNEGMAFSLHATRLGIPLVVVLPCNLPVSKLEKCTKLGAKVILYGTTISEAQKYARSLAKEKGLTYINARDHPQVLLGYGTLGLEIMDQTPFADAVILALGSGGLAGAVSSVIKHVKPSCLVYGVEAEAMPIFSKSLEKDEPITNMPTRGTLAGNALTMNNVGVNGFANAKTHIDKVLLVKEEWIARAMLHLVEVEKFIVEGSGALPLAAIIGNLVPELKTKNVVCILSGGNIDSMMLNRSLERGLAAETRLVKFKVGILCIPGAKRDLMQLLAKGGFNVITHFIDNTWTEGETFTVEVCMSPVTPCSSKFPDMKIVCETKGLDHSLELKRIVEKAYPDTSKFEGEPLSDRRMCPCYVRKHQINK